MAIVEISKLTCLPIPEEAKQEGLLDVRFCNVVKDWHKRTETRTQTLVIGWKGTDVYHTSLLDCMALAWATHRGLAISPDLLWFDLLSEIAAMVKEEPHKYKHLFSERKEKQTILVPSDEVRLPLDQILAELRHCVPTNTDLFLPEFSTQTEESRFAHYAAFADAASPFYNYMIYCCGIPRIRVGASRMTGISPPFWTPRRRMSFSRTWIRSCNDFGGP